MKTFTQVLFSISMISILLLSGCNSDDNNNQDNTIPTNSITGRWTLYNTVFISDNSDHICQTSCATFDFEANGTCLFTEHNELTTYTYLVDGDRVAAFGVYSGTYKATGKAMRATFAHLYRVKDGKIATMEQYVDSHVVQQALVPND